MGMVQEKRVGREERKLDFLATADFMQLIVRIVALALVVTTIIMVVKQQRPEIALQLSLLVGAAIFISVIGRIQQVIAVFQDFSARAGVNSLYLSTLLKIIGIAYIADFGAQICRDAGEGAIAAKIEFAAKILILIMSVPIMLSILDTILKLLA